MFAHQPPLTTTTQSDFKQQYQQLKQHRATVLSLLSDSHPEGKEATAPRSWWDWVYGWKPAPAVLTTIDGITVNEATTHGAAIRTAVDQLEHSKEAVAHLRWALVHLHATTTPAASPRAVAPTTPPRDIEAGIDHTTASAAAGTASLVLPIGDASSKKGKQLLKEQEKLDAQRSKVLELLQSEGSPAAAASEGAYEVDPASKQVCTSTTIWCHDIVVSPHTTETPTHPKHSRASCSFRKYTSMKSKKPSLSSLLAKAAFNCAPRIWTALVYIQMMVQQWMHPASRSSRS